MPRKFILHPFLLVLYTVLIPFTSNSDQVTPTMILRSLILVEIFAVVVLLIFQAILRDWQLAGLISFFFLAITLNYTHFIYSMQNSQIIAWVFRIAFQILVTILLIFVIKHSTWERISSHINLTQLLTICVALLLIFPSMILVRRGYYLIKDTNLVSVYQEELNTDLIFLSGSDRPDIYYIIADGYGRADVLKELYGFDNKEFISYLEQKGFVIASESRSNYIQTTLSLSSSMNMTLLNQFVERIGEESKDRVILSQLIQHSRVVEIFKKNGYKLVTFYPGFIFTNLMDADNYFSPFISMNEFEGLFLHNSILKDFFNQYSTIPIYGYKSHRQVVKYALDHLAEVPHIQGSKFVFIHLLAPHPPFVFDQNGNEINPDAVYSINDGTSFQGSTSEYIKGYTDQLIFLNRRLMQAIDAILASSSQPPIIIIQGDHGPGAYLDWGSLEKTCLLERTAILNAYYLPGVDQNAIPPTISPVNSFRLVLTQYFAQEMELVPDRTFFSAWDSLFQFVDITDSPNLLNNCGN